MRGTGITISDDERLYYGSNISQAPIKANKGSFFIITDNGLENGNIIDTYVFTKVWEKIGQNWQITNHFSASSTTSNHWFYKGDFANVLNYNNNTNNNGDYTTLSGNLTYSTNQFPVLKKSKITGFYSEYNAGNVEIAIYKGSGGFGATNPTLILFKKVVNNAQTSLIIPDVEINAEDRLSIFIRRTDSVAGTFYGRFSIGLKNI